MTKRLVLTNTAAMLVSEYMEELAKPGMRRSDIMETPVESVPDRLCIDPRSPFYVAMGPNIGVRFDGQEMTSVVEYCISEGWIRAPETGMKITKEMAENAPKRYGTVEVYFRSPISRQVRRELQRKGLL